MGLETYTGAAGKLLDCDVSLSDYKAESWANYPERFGFTAADIPELIRMASDPLFDELDADKTEAVWAPVHAVRALGQLRAEEAVAPLLELLLRDDDSFNQNIPQAIGLIGPRAIKPSTAFIQDSENDVWAQIFAVDSFEVLALNYPEHRQSCIDALIPVLENYPEREDELLDSSLIRALTELNAAEAAPLIETVFAHKDVDEFVTGSWPRVQVKLGLKQESDFTPEELRAKAPEAIEKLTELLFPEEGSLREASSSLRKKQPPLPQFESAPLKKASGFGGAKKTSKKKKR
ncbi:MAG: hypothetical protein ACFB4J_05625 [Elainellaceae cyanobacterium]